jgi:hypothetical protein
MSMQPPRFGFKVWRHGFWLRVFGCFLRVINRKYQPPLYSTRREGEWKLGTWGIKLGLPNSTPSASPEALVYKECINKPTRGKMRHKPTSRDCEGR